MVGCCENNGNFMHYVAFPREIFFQKQKIIQNKNKNKN